MKNTRVEIVPVNSNEEVADRIYWMKIRSAYLAREILPGQFVNILTNPEGQPLWRRPFSVARITGDLIEIIYKVVGSGTEFMSQLHPGDQADLLGPLGNSFFVDIEPGTIPLLIGGGLGFAPLIILRDYFVNHEIKPALFMGAPTETEHYYLRDDDANLHLSSDDGTKGYHGFITEYFKEYLLANGQHAKYQAYTCGPEPMMVRVSQICREFDVPLQVSIEREMACGIGLCQGCVIEQTPPSPKYALVCKDGPIFNANELNLTA